jgi:pimeloyl-ACP methyl ester carboxylesterase
VDLDNFPVLGYGFCKWGVLESEIDEVNPLLQNLVTLNFTRRTAGPFANNTKELFLSSSTTQITPIGEAPDQFPSDATWNPANGSYQDGSITFTRWPVSLPAPIGLKTILFRYLHFAPTLVTTETDGTELPLGSSTKKLVVLIHGWNPGSNPDSYTGEFASLESQLRSQLATATDWKLLKYHWEADADTGAILDANSIPIAGAVDHGTKSAEDAHQHGQHLGELLNETCPNLVSIHFIAHSAGAWAARATATYLLAHNPNVIIQITLLDPFIPGAAGANSSLTDDAMSGMALFQDRYRIFELENYYSINVTAGTQETFSWSSSDINFRVDYISNIPGYTAYGDN